MAKVAFISHASEDAAIAATISDYLENNGVSCWIAPRDLTPGREYSSEIVDGIESSAVFVLVLSENANESIYVKREVERAVSKGKPVFPIRVREVMPSKSLELFISSAHWIDAWTPPMEKYLERLAQSISAAAAVYPAGTPASAPARPAVARSWSAAKQRRLPAAIAAALVAPAPRRRWLVCLRLARPFRSGAINRGSGGPRRSGRVGKFESRGGRASGAAGRAGGRAGSAGRAAGRVARRRCPDILVRCARAVPEEPGHQPQPADAVHLYLHRRGCAQQQRRGLGHRRLHRRLRSLPRRLACRRDRRRWRADHGRAQRGAFPLHRKFAQRRGLERLRQL